MNGLVFLIDRSELTSETRLKCAEKQHMQTVIVVGGGVYVYHPTGFTATLDATTTFYAIDWVL
jgi:hypothetical protein